MDRYENMSYEELREERNELVNEYYYQFSQPFYDESILEDITNEIEYVEFMMLLKC
jgi:hypothetical protein